MPIDAPHVSVTHPDRTASCLEAIEPDLARIVDEATTQGWGTIETISAIEQIMKNFRLAYDADPDPADETKAADAIDQEPANDWPAA